jgi:glycosyltransferase involved in cell wall biosynthesis
MRPPGAPTAALHVLGPSAGGIRVHVAELARRTTAFGWAPTVAAPAGVMDGVLDPARDGVEVVALGTTADWSARRLLGLRRTLAAEVDGYELVHAHGLKAAVLTLSLRGSLGRSSRRSGRRRTPVVVTLHNDMVGTHTGIGARLRAFAQRSLLRFADHVVFVSQADADANRRVVPDDRRTVMMSFAARPEPRAGRDDTRRRFGVEPDAPLVVVVARLHPQKDLGMFLRAFAATRRRVRDARAIVAGDGPQHEELLALRDELGLTSSVEFIGATDAAADLMASADVVAISSRWEGGPIVAVEAMQLGAPVLMTDTGAVAELARGPGAAVLVQPGDVDGFAAALTDLLVSPDRRTAVAGAGRALAEAEFDGAALVHRIDRAYRRVLDRR